MERHTHGMVSRWCQRLGFHLSTHRPGDGRTRYAMCRPGQRHLFAIGAQQAIDKLDAWERGWEEAGGEIFVAGKSMHTEDCMDANDDTSILKGKCICPKGEPKLNQCQYKS